MKKSETKEKNTGTGSAKKIFCKPRIKTTAYVLLLLALTFLALIGIEFALGMILVKLLPAEVLTSPVTNSLFSVVSYGLVVLILLYLIPKFTKKKIFSVNRSDLGLTGLPTWTDILLMLVGYIVSIIIAAILTSIFSNFSWFDAGETQELGYSLYMQGWERGLAFIILVIIAPIMEELIFRGWLYGKLRVKIPKWAAALLVSALFGLVHMQWNVAISVFALSLVNCMLRELTGTIYAGTLVHMLNNGVAFFLVYMISFL